MPVPISARAEKYLGDSQHYTSLLGSQTNWHRLITLAEGEELIGVYENTPGQLDQSILITNARLVFLSPERTESVPYAEIAMIEWANRDPNDLMFKTDNRKLLILLKSGRQVAIPVIGSHNPGLDLSAFHSFLNGACQTLEIMDRKAE